jgi:hypothetical protein
MLTGLSARLVSVALQEHQELLEMTSVRERLVKEKDLMQNLTARSIQQRRSPTVARPANGRGLTMHVALLIFFVILLIWYFLPSPLPYVFDDQHAHTNTPGPDSHSLSLRLCRTRVIEDGMHAEEEVIGIGA